MSVQLEVESARAEAARLLGTTSDRWCHVSRVVDGVLAVSSVVAPHDADLLVAAAWLHDIGYADEVADTGFHPLDGARHLRALGASARLCALVAHHSAAVYEAEVRGLRDALDQEFPADRSVVADVLTYADMTTGPAGLRITVEERLTEILERYPAGHPVHEAITIASPRLVAVVASVEVRLDGRHPR